MLRQKSLGSAIMVSDFVNEVSGFVWDGSNMACLLLETNKDGYFTNDHLLDQVKTNIDILKTSIPLVEGFLCSIMRPHIRR